MNRGIVLSVVIAVGSLSMAAGGYQGQGQQAPKVVEVVKVKDNLFMFTGGGGNTAVFVAANGVVVVDTKNPGWGQPILDKIKTLTDKPVTMIINTHTHGDHVSGNVEFPATVDIVAQENSKINMSKTTGPRDERVDIFKGDNAKFLPKRTFKDKMSLGSGKDRIDLYYFGRGHTNGDAWVVFPALGVVDAADMFSGKNPPRLDPINGGSGLEYAQTLTKAVAGIKNVDTVITGHSNTTMKWSDFVDYGEFNRLYLAAARDALKAGKTPEQAAADFKLPETFKDYTITGGRGGPGGNFGPIFAELQKK